MQYAQMHAQDNVVTALTEFVAGNTISSLDGRSVTVVENIPFGHKIALRAIESGDEIIKYGEVIGRARRHIAEGTLVHVHNVESLRGRGDLQ